MAGLEHEFVKQRCEGEVAFVIVHSLSCQAPHAITSDGWHLAPTDPFVTH